MFQSDIHIRFVFMLFIPVLMGLNIGCQKKLSDSSEVLLDEVQISNCLDSNCDPVDNDPDQDDPPEDPGQNDPPPGGDVGNLQLPAYLCEAESVSGYLNLRGGLTNTVNFTLASPDMAVDSRIRYVKNCVTELKEFEGDTYLSFSAALGAGVYHKVWTHTNGNLMASGINYSIRDSVEE